MNLYNPSIGNTLATAHPVVPVPTIDKVIFNNPATIVMWSDGTKTIVKCKPDNEFNEEYGLAMAIAKKYSDNSRSGFKRLLRKFDAEQ